MKKNTSILIAIFVMLLVAAFLVLQKPGEQSAASSSSGFLTTIDSVSVNKIEIKGPAVSLVMEKHGAEWFIVQPINYKANQAFIGQIIHQVKNIEIKSTVSSKPEKHSVFQVDQTGTEVAIFEKGNEKISFILGKMAASYTESYARKLHSNEVLLIEGASGSMLNRPVKEWRDKTIFTTPRETINEVHYQYGDTAFTLSLKDSVWYIGKDKAQQPVVESLLSSLSSFQADDFIDSTVSPKIMATVMYSGVQLRFSWNKTAQKYTVQSSKSNQWFLVEPWKGNQILKRKKEIVELKNK
jgi:hypothetical protein